MNTRRCWDCLILRVDGLLSKVSNARSGSNGDLNFARAGSLDNRSKLLSWTYLVPSSLNRRFEASSVVRSSVILHVCLNQVRDGIYIFPCEEISLTGPLLALLAPWGF